MDGITASRKDDLESLYYTFTMPLPWSLVRFESPDQYKYLLKVKQELFYPKIAA